MAILFIFSFRLLTQCATVVNLTEKPGQCPAVSPFLGRPCILDDPGECQCDSDCDGDLKCCTDGCKLTCQKPRKTNITSVFYHRAYL